MMGTTGPTKTFNITLNMLRQMVDYAEKHGETEYKTIALHTTPTSISESCEVSVGWDGERTWIKPDMGCL